MKAMKLNSFLFILVLLFALSPFEGKSQFKLSYASKANNTLNNSKTKTIGRITLPFIDDFSNYSDKPDISLWENGGAWVNSDFPFLPPTVGVVTLDALDSYGILYSGANTTGFACDTISSCNIRLDSILLPSRIGLKPSDSIFLSFFFQPGGGYGPLWESVGSTPSRKDSLVLQFYCLTENSWNTVWKTEGLSIDSIYRADSVYWKYVNIPILEQKYFNNSFRFRFLNFSSLDNNPSYSYVGNCDQWHIDYVYLNKDRTYNEKTMRDIAFVNPASSLLKEYQAMPARQFTAEDMKDTLSIKIVNLSDIALNSIYKYDVFNSNGTNVHSYNGGFENIYPYITTKEFQTSPTHASPPVGFAYEFDGNFWTRFNIVHTVKEGVGQDSREENDTIRFSQVFENYFAYDDGTAENGFGIEPIKSSNLAVGFKLNVPDTLTAVDIYFNSTYNQANQKPFYLCVWNSYNGKPYDSIYRSSTYLTPTTDGLNQFTRYYLDKPLIISAEDFFVSIQTKNNDYMNIGFDRNTNSQTKIFGNWANSWEENTIFNGSLMIRPYFGYKAKIGLTDIEKENINLRIYPNPSNGIININLEKDNSESFYSDYELRIINMLGKEVYSSDYKNQINVSNLNNGVYLISIINKKTNQTKQEKIIIQK